MHFPASACALFRDKQCRLHTTRRHLIFVFEQRGTHIEPRSIARFESTEDNVLRTEIIRPIEWLRKPERDLNCDISLRCRLHVSMGAREMQEMCKVPGQTFVERG